MDNQNIKMLVVDDDPFVRDMLGMILQSNEYEVDTAGNGSEALNKIDADKSFNLVISDMNMPEMTGLELLKKLRDNSNDVPVIILTGNNEISVAIEAMNSGANDYLIKDENIQDTIVMSVQKVIEKHELKKKNIQLSAELALKNARFEKELTLAQKVQKNILPSKLDFRGFEIETFYRPSDKIGGDFFDAWEVGQTLHFLIGDVSGHGPSSALIMAVCKGMLQSLAYSIQHPNEIISTANRMLCDILSDSGMFLSLVYGIFDREKNELKVLSAGHNPVFLTEDGVVKTINASGPVLGWDANDSWDVIACQFNNNTNIFLYTDGLTEAKNSTGEEFGEDRLLELQKDTVSPRVLVDNVFKQVSDFCSGVFADDLTMLVIKRRQDNG